MTTAPKTDDARRRPDHARGAAQPARRDRRGGRRGDRAHRDQPRRDRVEGLLGDVLDGDGEPRRPAAVASSSTSARRRTRCARRSSATATTIAPGRRVPRQRPAQRRRAAPAGRDGAAPVFVDDDLIAWVVNVGAPHGHGRHGHRLVRAGRHRVLPGGVPVPAGAAVPRRRGAPTCSRSSATTQGVDENTSPATPRLRAYGAAGQAEAHGVVDRDERPHHRRADAVERQQRRLADQPAGRGERVRADGRRRDEVPEAGSSSRATPAQTRAEPPRCPPAPAASRRGRPARRRPGARPSRRGRCRRCRGRSPSRGCPRAPPRAGRPTATAGRPARVIPSRARSPSSTGQLAPPRTAAPTTAEPHSEAWISRPSARAPRTPGRPRAGPSPRPTVHSDTESALGAAVRAKSRASAGNSGWVL